MPRTRVSFDDPIVAPFLSRRRSLIIGRVGSLEARLTRRSKDIRRAQRLRYRVFYELGGAVGDGAVRRLRRDVCPLDRYCDHLVVYDLGEASRRRRRKPKLVGAYRLLRQEVAVTGCGFYSAREFAVADLIARHPDKRFLELGRSCVLPDYRAKRVLDLLWRSLNLYFKVHRIDVLFGCASLPGADPRSHAEQLAFLVQSARARPQWRVSALPGRDAPVELGEAPASRAAFASLPPLIKGYLRLGAQIGEGAVVDAQFGTTDVFIVLPVADLDARYVAHFANPPAGPRAAA